MNRLKEKMAIWVHRASMHPRAEEGLYLLSFCEAIFFPIPPDVLLVPITLARRQAWIRIAALTTAFSVIGALVGYMLGMFLFGTIVEPIIDFYGLGEEVARVSLWFGAGTFLVMFASALTPIPFKVFAVTAGLLSAPLFPFVIGFILGRGIRFFVEGYMLHRFGDTIAIAIYKMVNWYSLVIVLVVIFLTVLYLYLV